MSAPVRAKVAALCEALLAGNIDLETAVELFGGIAPTANYATAGFEESKGTWGKMTAKADIKQALLFVFSLVRAVHSPYRIGRTQCSIFTGIGPEAESNHVTLRIKYGICPGISGIYPNPAAESNLG